MENYHFKNGLQIIHTLFNILINDTQIMTQKLKPTTSFWLISLAALVWNLMGVYAYILQAFVTDESRLKLPETEQILYTNTPAWVTAAFAIAVFGGTLGSVALLLRKKWARPAFLISLMGIIAQMSNTFFMNSNIEVLKLGAIIMPIMVLIIGVYLIIYSKLAIEKGWIS